MTSPISQHPRPGFNFLDNLAVKGYVDWELVDEDTGKVVDRGRGYTNRWYERLVDKFVPYWLAKRLPLGNENAVVNHARNKLADAVIGTSVTFPQYIAVGTGTNAVGAADTALQTVSQYDGANDAKIANSRSLKGLYTSRIVAQFLITEANITIRELGLFEANDASQDMWARVSVNIVKASSERLNVYWYLAFERRAGLAIKTGESIATTGNVTLDTDSTLTFASAVTILMIVNNTSSKIYFKKNGAMNAGTSPNDYDFILEAGQTYFQSDEEIEVNTIHVVSPVSITMPDNTLVVKGW
tara:strand:+ start:3932 stop:4828 length:897 start_codon:yes stop_codon:yes gene_type:complete